MSKQKLCKIAKSQFCEVSQLGMGTTYWYSSQGYILGTGTPAMARVLVLVLQLGLGTWYWYSGWGWGLHTGTPARARDLVLVLQLGLGTTYWYSGRD